MLGRVVNSSNGITLFQPVYRELKRSTVDTYCTTFLHSSSYLQFIAYIKTFSFSTELFLSCTRMTTLKFLSPIPLLSYNVRIMIVDMANNK